MDVLRGATDVFMTSAHYSEEKTRLLIVMAKGKRDTVHIQTGSLNASLAGTMSLTDLCNHGANTDTTQQCWGATGGSISTSKFFPPTATTRLHVNYLSYSAPCH